MAASPGALGGLRGLPTVRMILSNIGVIVIPEQIAVGHANDAFDADGNLKDQKQLQQIRNIGTRVAELTAKIIGAMASLAKIIAEHWLAWAKIIAALAIVAVRVEAQRVIPEL